MMSADHPGAVLELIDVVKEYTGSPAVRALDGIDVTIERGELVAMVGPSGSGKSTMLHIVGALERPTAGTVRVSGHDVARLDDRQLSALRAQHIGFVFQQFHLLEGLTSLDNVATGLLYRGVGRSERRRRSARALALVGLAARAGHRPSQLSGGERQRVAIARAIVGEPAIVLADEPTGNLDTSTGAEIIEVLRSLHALGTTVVLITHDPTVAGAMDRCIAIRDGRVESDERRSAA